MNNNKKIKTLDWFEARVGGYIYRAPIFEHEQSHDFIRVKIHDAGHAKILFGIQRPGRTPYVDSIDKIEVLQP